MLALVLLVASPLTIACAICSAFLAYKERPQWVWFAAEYPCRRTSSPGAREIAAHA